MVLIETLEIEQIVKKMVRKEMDTVIPKTIDKCDICGKTWLFPTYKTIDQVCKHYY